MTMMSRVPLWADANRLTNKNDPTAALRPFFVSPQPAGRRITAGFSYLQRIGKDATTDVWFAEDLKRALDARLASGKALADKDFPAQWGAVRQFELLQEAGNLKIYDLDAANLTRTFMDLARSMRAGGYRVTVAMIGGYDESVSGDDLHTLDRRLQDRIQKLTHMLYLETTSVGINTTVKRSLLSDEWNCREALPHIGRVLGARDLFAGRGDAAADRRHRHSQAFFEILDLLPKTHIVHDTAVGLQLPESNAENEWPYIADSEMTLRPFNLLVSDLFLPFNRVKPGMIDGRGLQSSDVKGSAHHMRAYGERLSEVHDTRDREAVRYLARANLFAGERRAVI